MKARLAVLVVAAACAVAGATAHACRAQGPLRPVVPAVEVVQPTPADALEQPTGGWWDWDKQYL